MSREQIDPWHREWAFVVADSIVQNNKAVAKYLGKPSGLISLIRMPRLTDERKDSLRSQIYNQILRQDCPLSLNQFSNRPDHIMMEGDKTNDRNTAVIIKEGFVFPFAKESLNQLKSSTPSTLLSRWLGTQKYTNPLSRESFKEGDVFTCSSKQISNAGRKFNGLEEQLILSEQGQGITRVQWVINNSPVTQRVTQTLAGGGMSRTGSTASQNLNQRAAQLTTSPVQLAIVQLEEVLSRRASDVSSAQDSFYSFSRSRKSSVVSSVGSSSSTTSSLHAVNASPTKTSHSGGSRRPSNVSLMSSTSASEAETENHLLKGIQGAAQGLKKGIELLIRPIAPLWGGGGALSGSRRPSDASLVDSISSNVSNVSNALASIQFTFTETAIINETRASNVRCAIREEEGFPSRRSSTASESGEGGGFPSNRRPSIASESGGAWVGEIFSNLHQNVEVVVKNLHKEAEGFGKEAEGFGKGLWGVLFCKAEPGKSSNRAR